LTAPDAGALERMQRLLDSVPVEYRDEPFAWWPTSAIELWTEKPGATERPDNFSQSPVAEL
jgi:hypothetical protein